jgi:hypothetical protein
MSLKKSLVIALSHSGQTFPTLHATHALRKLCGDRVFVLTGSIDSKMSAAVGQLRYATLYCTYIGWSLFTCGRSLATCSPRTRELHLTKVQSRRSLVTLDVHLTATRTHRGRRASGQVMPGGGPQKR